MPGEEVKVGCHGSNDATLAFAKSMHKSLRVSVINNTFDI
jgi:hypothetical protein